MSRQVRKQDVVAIRNWIEQDPYLPKQFGDLMIEKYLFSCDSSLERTKRCIEELCTRRANMPEAFCDRDPLSPSLQTTFAITNMGTYRAGVDELLIHKLLEVSDRFNFYDCVKSFTMHVDNWLIHQEENLPENHIVVLDLKAFTMKLVPKLNIIYIQKFIIFLLETMPVRLKQAAVINCPTYWEYLYNLVKPALPDYIRNMVSFHQDHTGLYEFVDKKYLPEDYGGEADSLSEQNTFWVNKICQKRKMFLDDNYLKLNIKKPKQRTMEDSMIGSFKVLAID